MKSKFHSYFNSSSNEEKNSIKRDIEKDVDDIFIVALKNYQNDLEEIITKNDLLNTNAKLQKEHQELLQNVSLIKRIQKEYQANRYTTELFLYKIYFAEVLENGGFDVVIGNPPYVRQEKIKELKSKQEIQNFKSYNGTADLYIYFFEKGFKLLKENGILSFITSNKYTRARYGKEFREFVLDSCSIKEYIDFNGVKVFETATVDTSILSFQKNISQNNYFLYCDIDKTYKKGTLLHNFLDKYYCEYSQNDLNSESFSFLKYQDLKIKREIDNLGIPLKDLNIKINRGLVTGDNLGLVLSQEEDIEQFKNIDSYQKYIKKYIFGKDIFRYEYNITKYLISIPKNTILKETDELLIKLKERDEKLKNSISNRKEKGNFWYDLRGCTFYDLFDREIIVWSDIVKLPSFALTKGDVQVDTSAYFLFNEDEKINNKYLLAFLNSTLSFYYMKLIASVLGSGALRWKKLFVEQIPIPKIDKEEQKPFEILVDYIMFSKENNMINEAFLFEAIIDNMVFDLYFEEDMKKADCFLSSRVKEIVKPLGKYDTDEFKKNFIKIIYDIFKEDKTVQRSLIFSRNIEVVSIINGAKNDD